MRIDRPDTRSRRALVGAFLGGTCGLIWRELGLTSLLPGNIGRALIVVVAIALGMLLGLRFVRLLWGAGAVLFALWMAVAYTPLARALAAGLVRSDELVPADAAIVLGSDIQDDGDLTVNSQSRLLRGIELVRAGLAPRLVVTDWGSDPAHIVGVRRVLARLHLDIEVLVAADIVHNTHDEALTIKRLFEERGLRKALLVTSPLHSRRAAATFAAAGLDVLSAPCVEVAYDIDNLYSQDDRVRAFGAIVHERIGLLVYRWRGWLR